MAMSQNGSMSVCDCHGDKKFIKNKSHLPSLPLPKTQTPGQHVDDMETIKS
jgi:hypothetical protein